ncbi:MAG TPA: class I SAM-dependent methyltransferase [Actinomycetales bacterium]|nr:class I SAM-dependent methyltransferase [Actinomycetales bacterium]
MVLDLACGRAPVADRLPSGLHYVGVDVSGAELDEARARLPLAELHQVAAEEAVAVAGPNLAGVTVAMALMLLDLDAVLAPLAGVTVPGTRLSAIVPTRAPLSGADDDTAPLRDLGSLAAPFPHPVEEPDVGARLGALGRRLVLLEENRLRRPLRTDDDVSTVARSFYTDGSDHQGVLARLERLRSSSGYLDYPIRRLVGERDR